VESNPPKFESSNKIWLRNGKPKSKYWSQWQSESDGGGYGNLTRTGCENINCLGYKRHVESYKSCSKSRVRCLCG